MAHPRGPTSTEMWRVYFVDRTASPAIKDFLRKYYIRYSGPAGMTEQDDMENWCYATQASSGSVAKQFPFNYKAGLGTGGKDNLVGGPVVENPLTSEQNPRGLYRPRGIFFLVPTT